MEFGRGTGFAPPKEEVKSDRGNHSHDAAAIQMLINQNKIIFTTTMHIVQCNESFFCSFKSIASYS